MALSLAEVEKVAQLARLSLSAAEISELAAQLSRILGYVELLDELDVSGVEPLVHAIEMQNVFRDDLPLAESAEASGSTHSPLTESVPVGLRSEHSFTRADALANAPRHDGKYFLVPQILSAGN